MKKQRNKKTTLRASCLYVIILHLLLPLLLANFLFDWKIKNRTQYLKPVMEIEEEIYKDFGNNENCREFKDGIYLCSDNSRFNIEEFEDELEEPSGEEVKVIEIESVWEGTASYYSRAGCVGCHPQMIMANGEPLDDSKLTVAFNRAPLGSKLLVSNLSNGKSVEVETTDTGGFESLGRIVDLSLATKEAIECNDLCQVRVKAL